MKLFQKKNIFLPEYLNLISSADSLMKTIFYDIVLFSVIIIKCEGTQEIFHFQVQCLPKSSLNISLKLSQSVMGSIQNICRNSHAGE